MIFKQAERPTCTATSQSTRPGTSERRQPPRPETVRPLTGDAGLAPAARPERGTQKDSLRQRACTMPSAKALRPRGSLPQPAARRGSALGAPKIASPMRLGSIHGSGGRAGLGPQLGTGGALIRGELAQHGRSDEIVLRLTRAELPPSAGCVNEAIEAVEVWEFPTRPGAGQADAGATARRTRRPDRQAAALITGGGRQGRRPGPASAGRAQSIRHEQWSFISI